METPSEVITFKYDCTPRELREANAILAQPAKGERTKHFGFKIRRRRPPNLRRGLLGWVLFVVAATLLTAYLKQNAPPLAQRPGALELPVVFTAMRSSGWAVLSEITVASGVVAVVIAIGVVIFSYRWQRRRWKGRVEMSIRADGLAHRRPGMVTTHFWEAFRGVEVTDRLLLLRTDVTQATVIPKRLFANEAECARAVELLQLHTTKAAIPYSTAFPVIGR